MRAIIVALFCLGIALGYVPSSILYQSRIKTTIPRFDRTPFEKSASTVAEQPIRSFEVIKSLNPVPEPSLIRITLMHLPQIMQMGMVQFGGVCRNEEDKFALRLQIIKLFLPKILFPSFMGTTMLGLELPATAAKTTAQSLSPQNQLIGFVDLSLQTQSLLALDQIPLIIRKFKYGPTLRPYLCNLLVHPDYRKKGYAKRMVLECIQQSSSWGYDELYLHVEEKERPAWQLYKSLGFKEVKAESYAMLMKRSVAI